jgi:hypothetical protein
MLSIFFLLHDTQVLCHYGLYTADHVYLTYQLKAPNLPDITSRCEPHRKHSFYIFGCVCVVDIT